EDACPFVRERRLTFHLPGRAGHDSTEDAARENPSDYLAIPEHMRAYGADCPCDQYQHRPLPLPPPTRPPDDPRNPTRRPQANAHTIACATEADQGNVIPMEMLKRLLKDKGLHQAVMFHDVRWGAEHDGRFLWVLLNSGSCGAYAFNHDPNSLRGAHSYRQPKGYFPIPGGTFAGESLPGEITWARAYVKDDRLSMDIATGGV